MLRDVLFQLSIEERTPNTIIRPTTFDRELNYRIVRCTPDMAEASLRSVLRTLPGDFNEAPATFFQANGDRTHSGLVFVPTVNGKKTGFSLPNGFSASSALESEFTAEQHPRGRGWATGSEPSLSSPQPSRTTRQRVSLLPKHSAWVSTSPTSGGSFTTDFRDQLSPITKR